MKIVIITVVDMMDDEIAKRGRGHIIYPIFWSGILFVVLCYLWSKYKLGNGHGMWLYQGVIHNKSIGVLNRTSFFRRIDDGVYSEIYFAFDY